MNTSTNTVSADQNRKVQLLVQDDEHGHQNVATQMGTGRAADPEPGFRTQVEAPRMAPDHFRTREIDIAVIQMEFPRRWAQEGHFYSISRILGFLVVIYSIVYTAIAYADRK